MLNIPQIRQDTPHCLNLIHFNNAGCSLHTTKVVQVMKDYLDQEAATGGYELAAQRAQDITAFYTETARLIQAQAHNIAFATSCTEAYTKVLTAIPFKKGDIILTSDDDYASNQLCFLSLQARMGVKIIRAKNLANGDIDVQDIENIIKKKKKPTVVAITHVPTSSGKVQPVAAIGKLCRQYDIWYLVDACQSIGQMPVDVQEIGCDFLTATGRKFLRAPRGTGFLYVSDKALNARLAPLFFDNHSATWTGKNDFKIHETAQRFELFEKSIATVMGITEAIRYANDMGLDNIFNYNQEIIQYLRAKMQAIDGVKLYDEGSHLCNILTFRVGNLPLTTIQTALKAAHINASVTPKTYAQIDFERKGIDWAVRFSPHYYNTKEEMDRVITVLEKL